VSQLDDVNAFIHALKGVTSANQMRALVGAVTCEMGFHSFALVQHVKDFSRENERFLAVSNFSQGWVDYFLENKLAADEPTYAATRRTSVGFRLSDIPSMLKLSDAQRRVQEARTRESITDGFCVPAHIPGEANGSCTFVVKDNKPLPERNLPMAQLVGNFAYETARQLLRSGMVFVGRPEPASDTLGAFGDLAPKLTTRQLECVVLVARGKSDWEIAKILGLHEQTVTDHLNDARRRFGVSRRGELVIHSLFHGHITFGDVMH
jgi:LuxR family quorum-sensing system transcriptional regulator CciR